MKKLILIVLFPIVFLNIGKAQSTEALKLKIDSLNGEIKEINSKIELLYQNKNELNNQISNLNQLVNKNELENQNATGIPVKINNMGGTLRDKPTGIEIARIPSGDTIFVFDWYEEPYFKASYKDKVGYISYVSFTENKKISDLMYKNLAKENPKLARLSQKYGKPIANRLIKGEYWVGMTSEMAKESVGFPSDINKSTGSWGIHEQWVYDKKNLYLYFENGKLTSFQN